MPDSQQNSQADVRADTLNHKEMVDMEPSYKPQKRKSEVDTDHIDINNQIPFQSSRDSFHNEQDGNDRPTKKARTPSSGSNSSHRSATPPGQNEETVSYEPETARIKRVREQVQDISVKKMKINGKEEAMKGISVPADHESTDNISEDKGDKVTVDKDKEVSTTPSTSASATSPAKKPLGFGDFVSKNPFSAANPAAPTFLSKPNAPSTSIFAPSSSASLNRDKLSGSGSVSLTPTTPSTATTFGSTATFGSTSSFAKSGFGNFASGSGFGSFKSGGGAFGEYSKHNGGFTSLLKSGTNGTNGKEDRSNFLDLLGKKEENEEKEEVKRFETVENSVTGEEDEETIASGSCRLREYIAATTDWPDRGRGMAKVNRNVKTNKYRILMRTDQTYRLALNVALFKGMICSKESEKSVKFLDLDRKIWLLTTTVVNATKIYDALKEALEHINTLESKDEEEGDKTADVAEGEKSVDEHAKA